MGWRNRDGFGRSLAGFAANDQGFRAGALQQAHRHAAIYRQRRSGHKAGAV